MAWQADLEEAAFRRSSVRAARREATSWVRSLSSCMRSASSLRVAVHPWFASASSARSAAKALVLAASCACTTKNAPNLSKQAYQAGLPIISEVTDPSHECQCKIVFLQQ